MSGILSRLLGRVRPSRVRHLRTPQAAPRPMPSTDATPGPQVWEGSGQTLSPPPPPAPAGPQHGDAMRRAMEAPGRATQSSTAGAKLPPASWRRAPVATARPAAPVPPPPPRAPLRRPVRLVFEDGSEMALPAEDGLDERVAYLLRAILPPPPPRL